METTEIQQRYLAGEPITAIAADAGVSRQAIWNRIVRTNTRRRKKLPRRTNPLAGLVAEQYQNGKTVREL